MAPKVAVIFYTNYGHTYELAKEIQKGVYEAGLNDDIYRIPEAQQGFPVVSSLQIPTSAPSSSSSNPYGDESSSSVTTTPSKDDSSIAAKLNSGDTVPDIRSLSSMPQLNQNHYHHQHQRSQISNYNSNSKNSKHYSLAKKVPIATTQTLEKYDAFLFGIPSKFGNYPAEWKSFLDKTGALWARGALLGKPAGMFVLTGTIGGGQEATILSAISVLVHHGMIFVPLGYRNATASLKKSASSDDGSGTGNGEGYNVLAGSPWGSGVYAGPNGLRAPSSIELKTARIQGRTFAEVIRKF